MLVLLMKHSAADDVAGIGDIGTGKASDGDASATGNTDATGEIADDAGVDSEAVGDGAGDAAGNVTVFTVFFAIIVITFVLNDFFN